MYIDVAPDISWVIPAFLIVVALFFATARK